MMLLPEVARGRAKFGHLCHAKALVIARSGTSSQHLGPAASCGKRFFPLTPFGMERDCCTWSAPFAPHHPPYRAEQAQVARSPTLIWRSIRAAAQGLFMHTSNLNRCVICSDDNPSREPLGIMWAPSDAGFLHTLSCAEQQNFTRAVCALTRRMRFGSSLRALIDSLSPTFWTSR